MGRPTPPLPDTGTSEAPLDADVVIVGAGPSGLVTATRLAQLGCSTRVLDAATAPASESRAALMHASSVEILACLGLAEELIATGQRIDAITVADGNRVLTRIPFERLHSRYPFALGIPQDETERLLTTRLEQLGHTVQRGRRAHTVSQTATGCRVTGTTTETGEPWQLHARFVVAADGKNSTLRAGAGIEFGGDTYDEDFVLADVALSPPPSAANEARITFSPAGVTVIGRLPSGRYRIIATAERGRETPRTPDSAYLNALFVERLIPTETASEPAWSSRFRIGRHVAARFSQGNLFLCGDAAHVHSPAAGQGMNTGIADGYDLAERLAHALHGHPAPLADYDRVRRPTAREVVRLTDRITKIALLRSRPLRAVRNGAAHTIPRLPPARHLIVASVSGINRSPLHSTASRCAGPPDPPDIGGQP